MKSDSHAKCVARCQHRRNGQSEHVINGLYTEIRIKCLSNCRHFYFSSFKLTWKHLPAQKSQVDSSHDMGSVTGKISIRRLLGEVGVRDAFLLDYYSSTMRVFQVIETPRVATARRDDVWTWKCSRQTLILVATHDLYFSHLPQWWWSYRWEEDASTLDTLFFSPSVQSIKFLHFSRDLSTILIAAMKIHQSFTTIAI